MREKNNIPNSGLAKPRRKFCCICGGGSTLRCAKRLREPCHQNFNPTKTWCCVLSIGHKFNKSVLHDVFTGTCLGCNLFTIIMSYGGKGLDESVTWNLIQLVWWSACFQALVPWPWSRTNNTWRAKWLGRRYHAVVLHTDGYTRGKWSTRQPAKICQVVVLQVERLQRRSFHVVHKVLHTEENKTIG